MFYKRPEITPPLLDKQPKPTCPYCTNELDVPADLVAKVRENEPIIRSSVKMDGFYLSPQSHFYCDKECYRMFLES